MDIEEKVKIGLYKRGFSSDTVLNNRGLIGATIEETILRSNHKWIDATIEQPELIEGENYSKNVLAIINGELCVACYCYKPSEDEEESGYFWANCYGNIDGDAEFDDDYTVTYWQHLPELI